MDLPDWLTVALVPAEFAQLIATILAHLVVDLVAMLLLVFGLFYPRYRDKELVTAASLFNVFVFAVLTVLATVEMGVATGFGLFAILALFTLRSEPLAGSR